MRILFFFSISHEFYRRVLGAGFRPPCLVISQLYDRHYFLERVKKRQPLNNTSPPGGCTRIGYQPLEGATALFTAAAGVARISHRTEEKKGRTAHTVRENITTVIDRQTVISCKRKYTARNKL